MRIVKPIVNIIKYGSPVVMPQVDMDIMRPIFEESLKHIRRYCGENTLKLWKSARENLIFDYNCKDGTQAWVTGAIYAMEPRANFQDIDILSFMEITNFKKDKEGWLYDAIQNIVETAGIERVIAESPDIDAEYARILERFKGQRLTAQLNYGLMRP